MQLFHSVGLIKIISLTQKKKKCMLLGMKKKKRKEKMFPMVNFPYFYAIILIVFFLPKCSINVWLYLETQNKKNLCFNYHIIIYSMKMKRITTVTGNDQKALLLSLTIIFPESAKSNTATATL